MSNQVILANQDAVITEETAKVYVNNPNKKTISPVTSKKSSFKNGVVACVWLDTDNNICGKDDSLNLRRAFVNLHTLELYAFSQIFSELKKEIAKVENEEVRSLATNQANTDVANSLILGEPDLFEKAINKIMSLENYEITGKASELYSTKTRKVVLDARIRAEFEKDLAEFMPENLLKTLDDNAIQQLHFNAFPTE